MREKELLSFSFLFCSASFLLLLLSLTPPPPKTFGSFKTQATDEGKIVKSLSAAVQQLRFLEFEIHCSRVGFYIFKTVYIETNMRTIVLLVLLLSPFASALDELCAQSFCACADAAKTVDCRCNSNKQVRGRSHYIRYVVEEPCDDIRHTVCQFGLFNDQERVFQERG